MTSSELSNALNPHVVHRSRHRAHFTENATGHDTAVAAADPPAAHAVHRSELELAITEPAPPPPQPSSQVAVQGRNPVQELLRVLAATREAAEIERRRRLAWEKEQEAKYAQRQAELERQLLDMRQEISLLKAYISLHPPAATPALPATPEIIPTTARIEPIAFAQRDQPSSHLQIHTPQPSTPIPSLRQPPTFVQGCSSRPIMNTPVYSPAISERFGRSEIPSALSNVSVASSPTLQSATTETTSVVSEASTPISPAQTPNTRKRPMHPSTHPFSEGSSDDETSDSLVSDRPLKRLNGHDTRCLTIQHAMRAHILRCMSLNNDKQLPDSHVEEAPLGPDQPVRFVWDKTPKQSPHNAAMREYIVSDLRANRSLYRHVSEEEFSKRSLEAVFDQAFITLRQKFKAQRDAAAALNYKIKEDHKAMKARRLGRKKTKLHNRSETRKRLENFSHPTFDGALQQDCMSSEESCDEHIGPMTRSGTREKVQVLRIRGLPWRSMRLQRFFAILDAEESADRSTKPRRGSGRKERCIGPLKEGLMLPPKGVASWMVSRRWIQGILAARPDIAAALQEIIIDPPGFDWGTFFALGAESDDEMEREETVAGQNIPRSDTSYSLQYALTPM
ncbi:hypothetical protein CERSUDRAFT_149244 [Gelatoporia subvermispora B]|uniref:Uncharacterized protein n=1 Tax=Ceriporiopsis subvermispora (strain B) TaxID=914234 RepID=M2R8R1_CERS8|nr:hypothetical protein CERSUDRAFT_149244 [Gelatoporia subvermispora B]